MIRAVNGKPVNTSSVLPPLVGMIAPGTLLTDTKRRWKAKVRVDGSLDCEGQPAGSIHKVGAGVQGAPSCNGWTFWHLEHGGAVVPIDTLRQAYLLAAGDLAR